MTKDDPWAEPAIIARVDQASAFLDEMVIAGALHMQDCKYARHATCPGDYVIRALQGCNEGTLRGMLALAVAHMARSLLADAETP